MTDSAAPWPVAPGTPVLSCQACNIPVHCRSPSRTFSLNSPCQAWGWWEVRLGSPGRHLGPAFALTAPRPPQHHTRPGRRCGWAVPEGLLSAGHMGHLGARDSAPGSGSHVSDGFYVKSVFSD